jgi:CDP-diacylglycerol--glycerol-3-phosphate 3-phosphatidyltransferase
MRHKKPLLIMSLANKLTFFRIILAPVFFSVYLFAGTARWTVPALWIIFLVSEITDYFDGLAARKLKEVSDFGKFFDPFADTLMQITCFLCFVIDEIFPAILFLLVIYREFSILFLRNLMLKKGTAMGARMGGKIKTVAYIIASGTALLAVSFQRLSVHETLFPYLKTGALVIFIISVIIAVVSFFDYLLVYRKTNNTASENTK